MTERYEELARLSVQAMKDAMRGREGTNIFALISGGVDSSVALLLALRAGFDVTGVTMRSSDDCAAVSEAAALCRELGVESWSFDLRSEFEKLVADPFKSAYIRGETPNPCTVCNEFIKFGRLLDCAAERYGSRDFMVLTGHYARTERTPGGASLLMASERPKDQSYFLSMLKPKILDRLLLPLGLFSKHDTRALALSAGFSAEIMTRISQKSESMEICFLGSGDYRSCIQNLCAPGPIVSSEGKTLGTHSGICHYTIGQRKGLGLTSKEPLYVIGIEPETNSVIAGGREEAMTRTVRASGVNILAPEAYFDGALLSGKIRSQGAPSPCKIMLGGDSSLIAEFESPQFAPAPGQYLVLYSGERLVAGGVII